MAGGTNRASTVRALVRGESAVAFETALQDSRTEEGGQASPISIEHVDFKGGNRDSFSASGTENSATLDEQEDV